MSIYESPAAVYPSKVNFWSGPVLLSRFYNFASENTHTQTHTSNRTCQSVHVNIGVHSVSFSEANSGPNWQSIAFERHLSPVLLAVRGVEVLFFFFWVL